MEVPVLQCGNVRLELINTSHAKDLCEVGSDESIWKYLSKPPLVDDDIARSYIASALNEYSKGLRIPFAIIDARLNKAIGSTSIGSIRKEHKSIEIGWTWLGKNYQKTEFNTLCKYLLLSHAFDTLGCIRVELKTHIDNKISQQAIERLGAMREGVFRNHMILPDGSYRHSVFYSIIDAEWPAVKEKIIARLNAYNIDID